MPQDPHDDHDTSSTTFTTHTASPSTTERVVQVLLAFAHTDRPLGVSEIAHQIDVSKSVVHRILRTLLDSGLVVQDSADRRYHLGPMAHALGRQARATDSLHRAGMPTLAHLAELTGETSTMSERIGHRRCYIAQVVSPQQVRITISLGQQVPLNIGASGLCMLAFMPPEDIELMLHIPVPSVTERTMTDVAAIRGRLDEIRERGWATTSGERLPMSASIATPVFDVDGLPVGAISVAYLDTRIDQAKLPSYGELMTEQAREVSKRYQALVSAI
jgi:DNA-binding IclR family transcriptional regulator